MTQLISERLVPFFKKEFFSEKEIDMAFIEK
jgi:hypothetical protein